MVLIQQTDLESERSSIFEVTESSDSTDSTPLLLTSCSQEAIPVYERMHVYTLISISLPLFLSLSAHTHTHTHTHTYSLCPRSRIYRISGKFGDDLNLAIWRSDLKSPNLNSPNINLPLKRACAV